MKKKKLLIALIIILVITIAIVTVVIVKNINSDEPSNNNVINHSIKVTGKLQSYIANMGDNYYIKYSGKFRDDTDNLVQSIVEYTKSGEDFALRSTEMNMYLICEKDTISTISHRYKMIVDMPKTSFNISEYNLVSNIGQVYVDTYKEKIENTEYDVEEYLYNGKTLKYYFKEEDIRLIRYDGEDIKIIRLETKANTELLTKPTGYTNASTAETSYMQTVENKGDN